MLAGLLLLAVLLVLFVGESRSLSDVQSVRDIIESARAEAVAKVARCLQSIQDAGGFGPVPQAAAESFRLALEAIKVTMQAASSSEPEEVSAPGLKLPIRHEAGLQVARVLDRVRRGVEDATMRFCTAMQKASSVPKLFISLSSARRALEAGRLKADDLTDGLFFFWIGDCVWNEVLDKALTGVEEKLRNAFALAVMVAQGENRCKWIKSKLTLASYLAELNDLLRTNGFAQIDMQVATQEELDDSDQSWSRLREIAAKHGELIVIA